MKVIRTVSMIMLLFAFFSAKICLAQHDHSDGMRGHENSSKPLKQTIVNPLTDTLDHKTFYTCPMHPEVKSDKAGQCSKCGMNLEKKTEKIKEADKSESKVSYICPMHSDVKSAQKGKCFKCGMNLKKQKEYIYK